MNSPDYLSKHGDDLIPVKLVDLLCVCARIQQVWDEDGGGSNLGELLMQRLATCDLPRLKSYLPAEAVRELDT